MSQPANDDYSQHLSDDEESYHEEASDSGTATNKQRRSKETETTRREKVIENALDAVIQIISLENVQNHRKTRTKEHSSEVLGVISVNKMMKRLKTEHVSTRFGGNANSKKMQKAVLKQQFEAFSISSSEGLKKDMTAWSNLAMTMRTKPDVDTLSIDDLYNNLRVFEQELTSISKSSTSAQNVAFVSHSKNITNKVKSGHTGAYSTYTPTSSNNIQEREVPAGFTDEKEQNQNYLLTMDDGVVNWGEHTVRKKSQIMHSYQSTQILREHTDEEEEINHALMAISSSTEQQLSLNEQLTFQANEIYAKDEKLKRYKRIGLKAIKEKEQLKKTVDSWKDSSKNLWKLVDSGMTSNSKVGLGYEIKSNNEVFSYEEEMNRSVFKCTEEDYINTPLYSRFTKTNSFKGVPHPLTGDYTPKPQKEIDDSLYVYDKKGPQKLEISESDENSTEHSTCQSNDSEGSCGNTSKHSSESGSEYISVPNEMSTSKSVITNEKVVSESKEVEPSCAKHVKTPRQQMKNQGTSEVKGKNWNKMMERELG
ncbi:hypothetical protein Tco_1538827 [Tanacetum coccineum]